MDTPHSARLQYRLMLLEAVIKASVDFANAKITVVYNPNNANNTNDKTLSELRGALSKEGVQTDPSNTIDTNYDY